MAAEPCTFRATLTPTGSGVMPMTMLIVPEDVVEALGGKTVKRVVGTLNDHPIRRGLLPLRTGERYLLISKALRKQLRLDLSHEVLVTLAADPNPDAVDMPEELVEGLAEWPEAAAAFHRLTPGRQRNLVHYIEQAKRAETRAQRVVNLLHQLATGALPSRAPGRD